MISEVNVFSFDFNTVLFYFQIWSSGEQPNIFSFLNELAEYPRVSESLGIHKVFPRRKGKL